MMDFSLFLPPEILSEIFSFLPTEDRNRVRLVCRIWNECCNYPSILRKEKFVFRGGCYPLKDIDSFLLHCERIRDTVEFISISLDQFSSDIWRIIGKNISSLTLTKCGGSSEEAKDIFLHCSNMHSFRSSNEIDPVFRNGPEPIFFTGMFRCWDELIQMNVQRPQLTNFQVFVSGGDEKISEHDLLKIFKIFPCIRNFGTGHSSYLNDNLGCYFRGSLRKALNPALIKEFSFNFSRNSWLQEFLNVPELRLQKLETHLDVRTVPLETFVQFFQNQPELKTLKINLFTKSPTLPKILLSEILSICSELIDLRFKCDPTHLKIDELYSIMLQVSKSKLECFMLWFDPLYEIEDYANNLSAYLPPLVNQKLRTLSLHSKAPLIDFFFSPILKHFCNLHHLAMAAVSDEILQTIFEYHIHLKTLVLKTVILANMHLHTAFGFTDSTYSISRLQELTHLDLDESRSSHDYIEKTLRQLNLPRLKYLRFNLWGLEEEIDLEFLPAIIPSVEVLILNGDRKLLREYRHVPSKCLQRLKLIMYPCLGPEKIIEDMFIGRPSLKYAMETINNVYFYDRFSKDLRKLRNRDPVDVEYNKSVFKDSFECFVSIFSTFPAF